MLRCLHLADLHLGWRPQSLPEDRAAIRQSERDALLRKAVDHALDPDSGIDLVIIAGDLFDSHRPDPPLVEAVLRELGRLAPAGVQAITVPGNHDEVSYSDSVYRLHANSWPGVLVRNPMPRLVASLEVRAMRVHLYSLAYTGGLTRVSELRELPRSADPGLHVGVFHASLDWDAGDRSLPVASSALEDAGYDYVALGHVHQHREVRLGRGLAVYAGAIEHRGFTDPGFGRLTVVQFDDGRVNVETPGVDVRKHVVHALDVSGAGSQEELVESCRALSDPEALARIVLGGAPGFAVDAEGLAAALGADFFHVEIEDETDVLAADLVRTYALEATIRGCFTRRLIQRIDSASTERERRLLELALRKGLAAFEKRSGRGAGERGA